MPGLWVRQALPSPQCNGSQGVLGRRQESGAIEPMGSQRAVGSLPVPQDCWHFLLSPGHCMEHHISGSVLFSPPAFLALAAGSCQLCLLACSPSVLPAPISLLPKQMQRGHTTFPPHCACSCLFCCSFRICPCLLPCHGGEPHPWGNGRAPRCWGHCGVPVPPHARCWSWGRAALLGTAGSEGCARQRRQVRAGPAQRCSV